MFIYTIQRVVEPVSQPVVLCKRGFTAPTALDEGQPNFARCSAVSWAGTLYTLNHKNVTFYF